MNPVRALLAVLVGTGLFRLVVAVLETTLVGAAADTPVRTEVEYFAVRNQPAMLAAAVGYNCVAAVLAGYVLARIAGAREIMLATLAAAVQTTALIWAFTAGDYAAFTPAWTRVVLVAATGPAMIGGAAIRVAARPDDMS